MTWIQTVEYAESTGKLRQLYNRLRGRQGKVDNILQAHGLRPHTLEGHMALYKNVLHHPHNQLQTSFLETVGVYVSALNQCAYCVEHHFAGLMRLLKDDERASAIRDALEAREPERVFAGKELALLEYAAELTLQPSAISSSTIVRLRAAKADDGEILEVNQVTAYFAYANRTVLGLGVNTDGDTLGLSPGDSSDPENWEHR